MRSIRHPQTQLVIHYLSFPVVLLLSAQWSCETAVMMPYLYRRIQLTKLSSLLRALDKIRISGRIGSNTRLISSLLTYSHSIADLVFKSTCGSQASDVNLLLLHCQLDMVSNRSLHCYRSPHRSVQLSDLIRGIPLCGGQWLTQKLAAGQSVESK